MRAWRLSGILTAALALLVSPSLAAVMHVAVDGNDSNDGAETTPVATLRKGCELARAGGVERRVIVHAGTYYLDAPLRLGPENSGLEIVAAPGARPVLSGGQVITGWTKRDGGSLWSAPTPPGSNYRLLRAGDDAQTLARTPNADPKNPTQGGWLFVDKGPVIGEFSAGLAGLHTVGDWVEWGVDAPINGIYTLWMRYAAVNAPYFKDPAAPGRQTMRVDQNSVVDLALPDTSGWDNFEWKSAAKIQLSEGRHVLRWQNVKGGGLNFDAFALVTGKEWKPNSDTVSGQFGLIPASKAIRPIGVVVQAEAFDRVHVKELSLPELKSAAATDHFTYRAGDLHPFPASPEARVNIFPAWGWVNAILPCDGLSKDVPELVIGKSKSATEELRPGNRYFISNIFEGLDSPGEWWQDRKGNQLLWRPPDDAAREKTVVAANLDRLITVQGAERILLRGFTFRDTTYSLDVGVYSPEDAAIHLDDARQCVIEDNRFLGIGGYAMKLTGNSFGNEFLANEVGWAGQGGVILISWDRDGKKPNDNRIAGNWMHDLGAVYKHVAGVYCTTADRTLIEHNRFESLPRYAISFKSYSPGVGSHGNIAEYNEILRTNLETNDTGAIECLGRDKQLSGNIIRYNKILDVIGLKTTPEGTFLSPHMTWGVYLDDYSSGTTVKGNLIVRTDFGGVSIHGGRDNIIDNNIFANGVHQQIWMDPIDATCTGNQITRNIVVWRDPKPALFEQWNQKASPATKVLAESNFNVFWCTIPDSGWEQRQELTPLGNLSQWRAAGYDAKSIVADPLFTDPAQDDYRLQEKSPAKALGFEELPYEKMGRQGYERAWRK